MAYRGMKGSTNNAFDSYVERQNDDNVELLSEKVNTLKRFAISIGDEVRDQNRYIDSMGSDFDSNFGFLSGVMGKLKHVQKAGGVNV
ncbi:unnamed protein product [Auanema sp. JU1783]|nr:unnamed protein product [Auanema sp. JU1783]